MAAYVGTQSHFWRNASLLLVSTLTVMAGATIAPSLPNMAMHFSEVAHVHFWVQMILTIPGLVIAIAAPLVGWLLDKGHKKRLLILATTLYGMTGVAGVWLDHSLLALLISRIFLGLAVAVIMVTCVTLVGDYFTGAERGKYMGLLSAFGAFGGVLFVALAAWLASYDWQKPFYIYLLALFLLPLLFVFIEEPKREHIKAQSLSTSGVQSQHDMPAKTLLSFFYTMAFIEILVLYMVPVHIPFYLQSLSEDSPTLAGFAIAWMLLVMAVVSVTYKAIQKMQSFIKLHSLGYAILALGCICTGLANNAWQVFLALSISGIGLGVLRPNLVVWLMASTPSQMRGRVMGGLTSSFFIGQFVCPLITIPAAQHWGYDQIFIICGGLLIALALALSGRCWLTSKSQLHLKNSN